MKTFEEIYEELQNADNDELNNAWKAVKEENRKIKKITITICLIIDIITIISFFHNDISFVLPSFILPIIIFFMINILVVITINILFSKNKNKYQNECNIKYKKIVVNKIMSNFYDNLEYFPQKQMPEYIYKEPKYEYYSIYNSDDYFEAQIDNKYSIQMAEILTEDEKTYKDSDGNTKTRIIRIFHGLFAKIVMDKSINSELRVMQNGTIRPKDRLNMDSSEFEKYFDVKASNQIIGMQLLTADVMEELIEFKNKTNMKYDIFIKNNELYLRFHSGTMFEVGNIKNEVLDKNTIKKYFYMLNFTYNLSKKLIDLVNETQI